MAQNDLLKRYLDAGMTFTQLTEKKAKAIVKDLVKTGEIQTKDAGRRVEDLLDRSRKNTEMIRALVQSEVTNQLQKLGVLPKSADKGKKTPAAAKPKTATAKKATPAKKTVKKAAAKKTTAKKAAAPKATAAPAPEPAASPTPAPSTPAPAPAPASPASPVTGTPGAQTPTD